MKLTLLPFLVLLAVFTLPILAIAADVRDFDILGIRLGMTVAEVETLATTSGFEKIKRSAAPSFEQAVAIENRKQVNWQDYTGVQKLQFESDREAVQVSLVATPTGARVFQVFYEFFGSGVTREQMTAQVLTKYGEPDGFSSGQRLWGDTASAFSRKHAWLQYDKTPVSGFGRKNVGVLTLSDPKLQADSKAAIQTATAERATGKKPSF